MIDAPILLVEDNADDIVLTVRAFAKNGIGNEIIAVPDGESCLARLLPGDGASPLRPALVLLDINLPKLGGLEVLRRIRADERTRTIPVIMLTTSREERDIAEGYRIGANGFVRKPVGLSDFLDAICAVGDYWLTVNEPPPTGTHAP